MQNPLRKKHTITLEGVEYALRFERYDFALAQRELGEPFFPYGDTPVWKLLQKVSSTDVSDTVALAALDNDPELTLAIMHLLYAGLRRSVAGLSMDWITERVTEENLGDVFAALMAPLTDFSQRLRQIEDRATAQARTGQSAQTTTSSNSEAGTGQSLESVSASSGA